MREFDVRQLTEAVSAMVQDVNYRYPADVKHCLDSACEKETSRIGKATLEYLKLNAAIADEKHIPICQDTDGCRIPVCRSRCAFYSWFGQ